MSSPAVIEMHDATILGADGTAVLEHVNWHVEEHEFWVITGGHNSGKSALLSTIAGLNPVGGGEARVFGDLWREEAVLATGRRRVGLVFEAGGRLLRDLTVAENISLPVCYHENCSPGEAFERVLPLITALELEPYAMAAAGRIGRAWSQRVALARALAGQPELLLLDNPIAGLDLNQIRWWRQILGELAAGHPAVGLRPLTMVVATDDLRPWLTTGRKFALVQDRTFRSVGDGTQVVAERAAELTDWLRVD